MKFTDRIKNYIERKKIAYICNNKPKIRQNRIVFMSTEDYADNTRALFDYMIANNYNERYELVWLCEERKNYIDFKRKNVSSVFIYNKRGKRSAEAYKTFLSARYVFFSHGAYWIKEFNKGQTIVNLWHGCGYKGRHPEKKRKTEFDYCTITGEKYIEIQERFFSQPREKMLVLGYPRNDWLKTNTSRAKEYLDLLKKEHGCNKSIIWMPTFRTSTIKSWSTESALTGLGLPLVETNEEIIELNEKCKNERVLLVVKGHVRQGDFSKIEGLSNIIFLTNDELKDKGVILYELIGKTDAMLTDYSSVATDYMLTDKPLGYILFDFDEYERTRDWSFENVKDYMPGSHIYNMEDLKEFISDVGANIDRYREYRNKISKEMIKKSDCYCRDVLEWFDIRK